MEPSHRRAQNVIWAESDWRDWELTIRPNLVGEGQPGLCFETLAFVIDDRTPEDIEFGLRHLSAWRPYGLRPAPVEVLDRLPMQLCREYSKSPRRTAGRAGGQVRRG